MLKIRFNVKTRLLSGWEDNPNLFGLLQSRKGEDVAILDIPKPDADDYESFIFNGTGLAPSGKERPIPAWALARKVEALGLEVESLKLEIERLELELKQ